MCVRRNRLNEIDLALGVGSFLFSLPFCLSLILCEPSPPVNHRTHRGSLGESFIIVILRRVTNEVDKRASRAG